jgi:hypothetical protein
MAIWNILWPFRIFYGHLEYFMAIWNIIWYNLLPFCIVYGHLLYFSQLGMFGPRKIWHPCGQSWQCRSQSHDREFHVVKHYFLYIHTYILTYNTVSCLVRFKNKNSFVYLEKVI